jgi:hypothetical protein
MSGTGIQVGLLHVTTTSCHVRGPVEDAMKRMTLNNVTTDEVHPSSCSTSWHHIVKPHHIGPSQHSSTCPRQYDTDGIVNLTKIDCDKSIC